MSTAVEKEIAASQLRWYAGEIESAFDGLSALSAQAWDCPAADAFVEEASAEAGHLGSVAATLREVASSLESAAAAQRAAEAAAAVGGGDMPPGVL